MKTLKRTLVVWTAIIMTVFGTFVHAGERVEPFNRIVFMLDSSGSFQARRLEAVNKASSLVDEIAARKTKRYETKDEVIVISLDAIPEVIWRGTSDQLKNETPKYWKQRFDARRDYQACTDVENGLILAAQILHQEPQPSNLFLFAFTDLIHEPATAKSATKCKPAVLPSVPSRNFDWNAFKDVEAHVLWLPINQKMAWFEATKMAGLNNFHLYSESDSASIKLIAPDQARRVMNEEERTHGKEKVTSLLSGVGKVALYGVLGIGVLMVGGGLLTSRMGRQKKSSRRGK